MEDAEALFDVPRIDSRDTFSVVLVPLLMPLPLGLFVVRAPFLKVVFEPVTTLDGGEAD